MTSGHMATVMLSTTVVYEIGLNASVVVICISIIAVFAYGYAPNCDQFSKKMSKKKWFAEGYRVFGLKRFVFYTKRCDRSG